MEFKYTPLKDASHDIRLVDLLPGPFSAPLRLMIWHTPLPSLSAIAIDAPYDLSKVQKSLPPGWSVDETLDGNLLFSHESLEVSTWTHPDPGWNQQNLYRPSERPPPDFEPRYEALSYLWGSPDDPRTIQVSYSPESPQRRHGADGAQRHWSTMSAGQNLEGALRHLRSLDKPRTLWIDAICINQDDNVEKSKQIARMSALYQLAYRVVVWLGPEDALAKSSVALSTLEYLGRQVEWSKNWWCYPAPGATELRWYHSGCHLPYSEEVWIAITALASRGYFKRLWIWQEVALANSRTVVICGRQTISWLHFIRGAWCLYGKNDLPSTALRTQLSFVRELAYPSSQLSVAAILAIGRRRQCFDTKDKIYGVLGITPHAFTRRIQLNYAFPAGLIFKEAALAAIQSEAEESLSVLGGCAMTSNVKDQQTPSWVPNWALPSEVQYPPETLHAGGYSKACYQFIAPDTLRVTGRRLTILEGVSGAAPHDEYGCFRHLQAIEPKDLMTSSYVSGGSLLDAFLLTLRMNQVDERWPSAGHFTLDNWRTYFLSNLSSVNGLPDPTDSTAADARWKFNHVKGRTFVRSVDGHIGLAPAGATPGDIACVFLGCYTSILLRRSVDQPEKYRVVGPCYIHGLDDIVGLLGPLPYGWRMQFRQDESGCEGNVYIDPETNTVTFEDPRLGALPVPWVRTHAITRLIGNARLDCFTNTETGEVMHSDPRLLPAALESIGVKLEDFLLY